MPGHCPLQQKAGNDEAVDFIGTFENAIDARIAVVAFRRIFFDEAVSSVDLHHLVDHVVEEFRSPNLEDRALDGILVDQFPYRGHVGLAFAQLRDGCIHLSNGSISHRLAREDADRDVGNLLANQAEVGDHLAERLALLSVRDGALEAMPRRADGPGTQFEAAHVENVEGDHVSLTDFAEDVLHRNLAVIEDERTGRGAANPHLVLFRAYGKARELALHDEGGELLSIHLREHNKKIGETCIGNPHLLAVQDVVFAIAGKVRLGAAIQRIGTR